MNTKKLISLIVIMTLSGILCSISAQVMNISSGLQIVASGTVSLVLNQGGIKNDGAFIPGNSTVFFDGAATTAISGSHPVVFYNVSFRGSGIKVNNGAASVIGTLAVEGTTVLDADGISNDRLFILISSDTATASVDKLTGGNIIGNVTVERFINTGTNAGQHAKSWQFLATPTTGQTFFQSWQEGGATPPGFGTILTGTGIGFDITTLLPSVKFYNEPAAGWTGISNTSTALQNKLGYMLFVRGDRTVTTYNGAPNNTNMRSKGILFTPFNPPASVAVPANRFQSFGNPYASRIAFNDVYLASTGINNVFYVWDPKLGGTYLLGGYQAISAVVGYIPTAGSSTTYYPAGVAAPFIESGQAVFVPGNATGGNINFNENCKVPGSRLVNKSASSHGRDYLPVGRQLFFSSLFTQSGMIADGNIVAFENGLGNELNGNDAGKFLNAGENFCLIRNEQLLAVEARNAIAVNDTIFYYLQNLRQQPYQFRFAPVNIPPTITAFLIDRFNNSRTPVSVTDSSFIDFQVGTEPGAAAADRFILVFQQAGLVPLQLVHIAAKRDIDQTNLVTWEVVDEINLQEYIIERSTNGRDFFAIGKTIPSANNGGGATYHYRDKWTERPVNFYRIKAVSNTGHVQYSGIVKVETANITSCISVFPNPVTDKTIHIHFINQQEGNYRIKLINCAGQLMYDHILYVDGVNVLKTIKRITMASGVYQLDISGEDGIEFTQQVIVK